MLSHMYPSAVDEAAGTFVDEQVRALVANGVDVRVCSPKAFAPPLSRFRAYRDIPRTTMRDGVHVDYPRQLVLPRGLLGHRAPRVMRRAIGGNIFRVHRGWPIDVIHAHTAAPDGWAAIQIGRALDIPVVVTAHGADVRELPARSEALHGVVREAIEGADQFITVSQALRELAEAIGKPGRPTRIVPNGADTDRFSPRDALAARRKLGLPELGPLVVYVGQLKRVKGVDVLVEAMGVLARREQAPRLAIVGAGPMRAALAARIAELGLSGRVTWAGQVPHDEVAWWLAAADVAVLPSRSEGLPTAACEAMACQRAVVATRVGGTPEAVIDGETGLLVPSERPELLADALAALITDPNRAAQMGIAGRARVLERFTWATNAATMTGIYSGLAHG